MRSFDSTFSITRMGLCLLAATAIWIATAGFVLLTIHPALAESAPATPSPSQSSAKPAVAVLRFESAGATPVEASATMDRFQEELFNTGKFTLVDRGQIDHVLDEQVLQQSACTTTECAVKVGKLVGARLLIAGKVSKLDDKHWLISAQMIAVETGQTQRVGSVQYEGAFFDLLREGTPVLAARIADTPAPTQKPGLASRLIEMVNPIPVLEAVVTNTSTPGEPPPNAPKRGFSLFTGYSHYDGTVHLSTGGAVSFSGGGGPSIGLDYQWVVGERTTLGVFFVSGNGTLNGDLAAFYDAVGAGDLGLELRRWTGRSYVGLNVSSYILTFTDYSSKSNDPLVFDGTSFGVTTGYEWDGGWYIGGVFEYGTGHADTVFVHTSSQATPVPLGGSVDSYDIWIHVGYRWK